MRAAERHVARAEERVEPCDIALVRRIQSRNEGGRFEERSDTFVDPRRRATSIAFALALVDAAVEEIGSATRLTAARSMDTKLKGFLCGGPKTAGRSAWVLIFSSSTMIASW